MIIPRSIRLALASGALGFLVLQAFQPEIEARDTRAAMAMPPEVEAVLRTSCFDCHSNETKLLWFDRIAPASWLVARDVQRGRAVLNFSELGQRSPAEQRAKLFESIAMIAGDSMPPPPYRALHRGAAVHESAREALRAFATHLAEPPMQAKIVAVSLPALATRTVASAPNGLAFPSDVSHWSPLELSERWDNGSLRVILGNPTAVEAVKASRTSPWPEGASLAKVAFRPGDAGAESSFLQIELMQKVGARWAWARWVGSGLVPYGHDASFADECRGCHEPMRDRDFVYSVPSASFDASWGSISEVQIDAQRRFRIVASRAVTWPQRDDPNWFGARISTGAPTVE